MAEESDEGIWALIFTAGARYVGKVMSVSLKDEELVINTLEKLDTGVALKLMPAFDLSIQMIPIPIGPGKMAMQREVSAGPVGLTLDEAPVYMVASSIQFFDDMKPADKARYKRLVEQAVALCINARLQESGLTTAQDIPGGPSRNG